MAQVTVFISYSSADRMEALGVRRLLTARGCTVWLDVFDIRVSADVKHELGAGIAGADVLCLLLSPTAVASPWVAEEIARGEEQTAKRGMPVIPVLLRPCRPPDSLLGTVMLDATAGIDSPDVMARLARAVLGQGVVGDREIDAAMQETLQDRQNELEAAQVLPELAQKLKAVRRKSIRKVQISFRHTALPLNQALAVGLTFDTLFSQPMWFLFAHYREGHTWPKPMQFEELDHSDVRSDGKRVDGRFQWFDRVTPLTEQIDGTDLRDRPATFDFEMSGASWQPGGAVSSYAGGPSVQHLRQRLEIPSLAKLIEVKASFRVTLLGQDPNDEQEIAAEENDLDICVTAGYESGEDVTLYRSTHHPVERAVLKGAYLSGRESQIEREAILGLYPRTSELATAEYVNRRRAGLALLDKAEEQLSPEERRVVARLRYGQAQLYMFRVFGNAPPPGPERQRLHQSAIEECLAIRRLLEPIIAAGPEIDDVGMSYWAASNLARYYQASGVTEQALPFADAALSLVRDAAAKDPDEPDYQRWTASALERLAGMQASRGERDSAVASLNEAVGILQRLYEELPNAGRRRDLKEALTGAIQAAREWKAGNPEVQQHWMTMSSELEPAAPAGRSRAGSKARRRSASKN